MTLPAAAALAAQQLLSQRLGIALGLFGADDYSDIEIQRAPDSAGAPNVGAAVTIATVAPSTRVHIDELPLDGARRHYRIRATGLRGDPSAWTDWVNAIPGTLPPDLARPDAFEPVIKPSTVGTTTDVSVTLSIFDPQRRVTSVEFRTQVGAGAWSAWTADTSVPYSGTATLTGSGTLGSRVGWRVFGYDRSGIHGILREGESLWPINTGVNPVVVKLTRARYNSGTGKYEAWMRYFYQRGNDSLIEDPILGFVTLFGAQNIKDQAGTAATGYTFHDPKESDGWRVSWNSSPTQQWAFELFAHGLFEQLQFPGQNDDSQTSNVPTVAGSASLVGPPGAPVAGSVAQQLTFGGYLTVTPTGTYDGSVARTIAVDAATANTASKVVARDANGDFAARDITGRDFILS